MPRQAQALAFSKFQGPLFQPIRAPYLSEDPQKPRLPSSTLNSGPNRSKLKYVLRGTLNRTLSDSYVVRPCRCRVVRRRRAPSVRKVMSKARTHEAEIGTCTGTCTLVDQSDQNPQCLICAFETLVLRPKYIPNLYHFTL